jgi:hypothetical protein
MEYFDLLQNFAIIFLLYKVSKIEIELKSKENSK